MAALSACILFLITLKPMSSQGIEGYTTEYEESSPHLLYVDKLVEEVLRPCTTDYCPCSTDDDCLTNYTPGIDYALQNNATVVHEAVCQNSTESPELGLCTCGDFCYSRSATFDDIPFFYCGPCGRIGSVCDNESCTQDIAVCNNGYCACPDGGTFYEIYYCYIPYYGYEAALQLAVVTCIVIAICLLGASIYNAIGFRRLRRLHHLRTMLLGEAGVRESPPDDIPPKYEDVVEDLPSYEDALNMAQGEGAVGIVNMGFEDDSATEKNSSAGDLDAKNDDNNSSPKPHKTTKRRRKATDTRKTNIAGKNCTDAESGQASFDDAKASGTYYTVPGEKACAKIEENVANASDEIDDKNCEEMKDGTDVVINCSKRGRSKDKARNLKVAEQHDINNQNGVGTDQNQNEINIQDLNVMKENNSRHFSEISSGNCPDLPPTYEESANSVPNRTIETVEKATSSPQNIAELDVDRIGNNGDFKQSKEFIEIVNIENNSPAIADNRDRESTSKEDAKNQSVRRKQNLRGMKGRNIERNSKDTSNSMQVPEENASSPNLHSETNIEKNA